jgi:chromosomal replication initiation ATPase DnaA
MSLPQIGEVIDKDHTSVLNACAQMERLLNGSAEWRADYAEIESAVLDKSYPETRL